ncbi:heavy metal/cation efflux pump CzcB/HlyD [Gluconacetobacter johannae DSM 13595]|nr:efflux RND transporter periplasmic adaptor subunit [Gluconacetobacter johannae]GBQ79472.1 heavy metal/cation efflux pump CzcB/HlyD [Gluconacetobacter johannae DSM 13595]
MTAPRLSWLPPVLLAMQLVRAHVALGAEEPVVTLAAAVQASEDLTVVPVRRGTVSRTLTALAHVEADGRRVVHVRSAGSGKIRVVAVMPGSHVARGDRLIDYQDHALHVARLQAVQMRAALAEAIAARGEAAAGYERARLLSGSTVSAGEARRRLSVLQQATDLVRSRQADVDTLDHRFAEEFNSTTERGGQGEMSSLISPLTGTVLTVAAGVDDDIVSGQDLVTVADLSRVWLVSEVTPDDARRLAPGAGVTAVLPGEDGNPPISMPVTRIDTIDGAASPATGLVRVIATVANPDGALRPGTLLDARLATTESASGLIVPTEAVQRIDGRDMVFLRTGKESFRPVAVRTGLGSDDETAIVSGLRAGDMVVSHGGFALKSVMLLAAMGGGD